VRRPDAGPAGRTLSAVTTLGRLGRLARRAVRRALPASGPSRDGVGRGGAALSGHDARRDRRGSGATRSGGDGPPEGYPGDFEGVVEPVYAPDLDGDPDPGEIVWTWVPYEEDHTQGKDRPVLVVGHDGPWLLGLALTTRDHDTRPGRPGEVWMDLGAGAWDAKRRPSEIRLDRVLRIRPDAVRREGAVLDRARFDEVVGSLRRLRG
jgi:hypothetical protein